MATSQSAEQALAPSSAAESKPQRSPAMGPTDFVFPRRAPTTITGNTATRPRSGTHDATMLLAEIGVLPPPMMATGSGRVRGTPYHPGSARPKSMLAMPTTSAPVTLAPAPMGRTHRREASEFLSPDAPAVKTETEVAEAPKPKPGPPAGFRGRGHAHRRSGAISSSDVWGLISQSSSSAGLVVPPNSAPLAKPAGVSPDISANNSPIKSWSAPVTPGNSDQPEMPTGRRPSRVAFHDEVEIIPRPLSPTSTINTVTPHGGSSSISSIADFNNSGKRAGGRNRSSSICSSTTPLSAELQATFAHKLERPSTSGGLISTPKPRPEPLPTLRIETEFPKPTTVVPKPPSSPSLAVPEKKKSKKTHKKPLSDLSPSTPLPPSPSVENSEESEKSKAKKEKRKKKHLKNFLFRNKGKKGSQSKRSPTPPLPRTNSFRNGDGVHEAWAESYVLMQEPILAGRSLEELSSTMSPRYNHSNASFTQTQPTIDLDAALMPFNSPAPVKSSGGFNAAKKRMHSSGAGGKMSSIGAGIGPPGFGSAFVGTHRRSESMPEMPSFMLGDAGRMEMDDVFEEDEEEEDDSGSGSDSGSDSGESEDGAMMKKDGGLRIQVEDTDSGEGISRWQEVVNASAASSPHTGRRHSYAPCSTTGISPGSPLRSSFKIAEEEEQQPKKLPVNTSFAAHRANKLADCPPSPSDSCTTPTNLSTSASSTSTVTPTPLPPSPSPFSSPFSFDQQHQQAINTPATSFTSAPSPHSSLPSTPTQLPTSPSYPSTPTIKELAALSALEDESHFPMYASSEFRFLGEPGPEMRMSVDDVPSLTSSTSTMTSSYAAYCLAGGASQPATPRVEEVASCMGGGGGLVTPARSDAGTASVAGSVSGSGKEGKKAGGGGLKKKLSRVFRGFWEKKGKEEKKTTTTSTTTTTTTETLSAP